VWCPTRGAAPPHEAYWFRFQLWIAIFSFVASYFFSEAFFDVLGMKYNFPHLKWNLDSVLMGEGKQTVPLMMYVFGFVFFVTYFSVSIVVMRTARESLAEAVSGVMSRDAWAGVATVLSALFFAWAEIRFTTLESINDQFAYADMDWALSWGAAAYACYFIPTFPIVQYLDEDPDEPRWSMRRVLESALAGSMLAFILLDVVCQFGLPRDAWHRRDWWPQHRVTA